MRHPLAALLTATTLGITGCSGTPDSPEADVTAEEVSLTVLAAASLQKSFDEIGEEFTADHPHITLDFNYAGSSTLVENLEAGVPADVFASADESNMHKAEEADVIEPETRGLFASNKLVGIVPSDNPADVSTLEEANAEGVNLVVCAPQVPCGALSQTLADAAGMTLNAVSEEQQVTDVLGKVRSGQADAGLVYATDAALAPDEIDTFDLDGAEDALNMYPIARTADSTHPDAADTFIEYVHSEPGQAILEKNGFTAP
ncbi:MAG TPA: molybdate ABC transporter substrate-binding protein [Candidatus Yaniella excrementavium]|nr:molybdate ABC transporter substrate-binding protein [Candidatus Yaniella excrementavium]